MKLAGKQIIVPEHGRNRTNRKFQLVGFLEARAASVRDNCCRRRAGLPQ